MKQFNVKDAPNALRCRKVLAGLSPVKERWKGKPLNPILYVFVGMSLMGGSIIWLATLKVPIFLGMPLALLWFPFTIFMVGYEQVLVTQNYAPVFEKYISEYLDEDEKFLSLLSGRGLALNIPDWLPDDFFHRSIFIFTSDRILIITFKASTIKNGDINYYVDRSGLENLISGIYCCDYLEKKSFVVGGIILNILANIAHSKVKVQPVGEKDSYPWAIEHRGTRNGRLLEEILTRVNSIGSRSF